MKTFLKVTLWILALILFPIATVLYYIWSGNINKDKISKGWKIFWWILYVLITFPYVVFKLLFCCYCIALIAVICNPEYDVPTKSECSSPSTYRTNEDFYKLTGVEFPELEIVDSLFFDEGCLRANMWNEYKFVTKSGANKKFYKRLKNACKTDSTHWSYSEGSISDYFYNGTGEPIVGDRKIFKYWIYPNKEPVDRSRGMCDRMVELDDDEKVVDWDGSFISVEVLNDTIILREGWLR